MLIILTCIMSPDSNRKESKPLANKTNRNRERRRRMWNWSTGPEDFQLSKLYVRSSTILVWLLLPLNPKYNHFPDISWKCLLILSHPYSGCQGLKHESSVPRSSLHASTLPFPPPMDPSSQEAASMGLLDLLKVLWWDNSVCMYEKKGRL